MKYHYFLFLLLFLNLTNAQHANDLSSIEIGDTDQPIPIDSLVEVESLYLVDRDDTQDASWIVSAPLTKVAANSNFTSMLLAKQLEELNELTPLEVVHNPTIERFIRVYLKSKREYFSKLLGKSKYYFPLFEQSLDQRGLPLEIKFLAVVESALNPTAVSQSGAKGLWQFMYGTATDYNLYIDSYVDERFDIYRSTEAAINYLEALHAQFGNWDLALAAYNAGPNTIVKAIQRANGSTNFWEIRKYLPRETRSYVPAFYATMYLFNYSWYHSLEAETTNISYQETDTILLQKKVSLKVVQQSLAMDYDLLKRMNPQYHKDLAPRNQNHTPTIRLPKNLIGRFIEHESLIYKQSSHLFKPQKSKRIPIRMDNSYLVQEGDNLYSIASKFGISMSQLKSWNGLETNFLIAQQRLVITDRQTISGDDIETTDSSHRFSGN